METKTEYPLIKTESPAMTNEDTLHGQPSTIFPGQHSERSAPKSIKSHYLQPLIKSEQRGSSVSSISSDRSVKLEEQPSVAQHQQPSTPVGQNERQQPIPHSHKVHPVRILHQNPEHPQQQANSGLQHQPSLLSTRTLQSFLSRDPRDPGSFSDLPPLYHDLHKQPLVHPHSHLTHSAAIPMSGYVWSPDSLTHEEPQRPRLAGPAGSALSKQPIRQLQQTHSMRSGLPGPPGRAQAVLPRLEADAGERQHLPRRTRRNEQQAQRDEQQFQQLRAQMERYLNHGAQQLQPRTDSLEAMLERFKQRWRPFRKG